MTWATTLIFIFGRAIAISSLEIDGHVFCGTVMHTTQFRDKMFNGILKHAP